MHPKHNVNVYAYCMLKLMKPFTLSPSIQVAALTITPLPEEGDVMVISGWGPTSHFNGSPQPEHIHSMGAICTNNNKCPPNKELIDITNKDYAKPSHPMDSGAPYYSFETGIVYGIVTFDETSTSRTGKVNLVNYGKPWIREVITKEGH